MATILRLSLSRELTGSRPADTRKMKPAGRRGNIGPSAGLIILELTEKADRPTVVRPMLRFCEAGRFNNLSAINLNSN